MTGYFVYKNKKVAYRVKGSGKSIVLLHGFMESMKIWNAYTDNLSNKYQVVTIDLPGFGKSECFSSIHTMEFMAGIVNKILNKLLIKKCVMVGHSMGGYIALAFAEKFAGKIRGLVIFHSHAKPDTSEAKVNRNRMIRLIEADKGQFIFQFFPELFAPQNVVKYQRQIEKLIQQSSKISKEGIIAATQGMKMRTDKTHVLSNANFPILYIAGALDHKIPVDTIMEQIRMPRQSELLLLKDVGHMGFIEAKSTCLSSIKSFADRVL
jgi:pimeloyl-ACP methyl ester carboxylesterase